MHYLVKRINQLPPAEKHRIFEELVSTIKTAPATLTDQIELHLLSEYTEAGRERAANFGKLQGLSTGFEKLDALTKGMVGGELTVIAGKTSYGKTTLALNIANKIALSQTPTLFVSLEMTKPEIASRYIFINGGADSEDYQTVSALTAMQANDELSWQSIDPLIEHAKSELNVGLVVIDHLHYFSREVEYLAESLGRITKEFKKNAIRHNVPIILISHVRKVPRDEEVEIDDLRGSSYIGQDADVVLMVGRKKTEPDSLFVKIHKNRNRGFRYDEAEAVLFQDKIKLYDEKP